MIRTKDNGGVQFKNANIPKIRDVIMEKEFDCFAVDGKIGNLSLIIVGLYRSPGSAYDSYFLNKLDIALGLLCNKYDNAILAGT